MITNVVDHDHDRQRENYNSWQGAEGNDPTPRQQAVALHLAGKKFDEIAEIVGYSDRGAAYNATMRAIKRETVEDIGEIRNVEIARIDAMLDSVWPVAIEDPEWIRQFADAKKVVPLKDDEGREVVFIVPSYAKLEAIAKVIRLMERRARYMGLDHADGLAERLTQLREQESELMVQFMTSVMEEIELTDEQRAKLEPAMQRQLRVVNGEHDRDRSRHRHGDRCR